MGTASSVNVPQGTDPLSFHDALSSLRLAKHEEIIASTVGTQDQEVLVGLKERLKLTMDDTDGNEGTTTIKLADILNKDQETQELLSQTTEGFKSMTSSLMQNIGEKARIVTTAQIVGLLSAPVCVRKGSANNPVMIVMEPEDDDDTSSEEPNPGLRQAVSNYNESTRLINYVMDGDGPATPRSDREQQHKRNRKASLSIGIDVDLKDMDIAHKEATTKGLDPTDPPLTKHEAAIIIQKNYRGFLSRHPTPRPPMPPK